MYARVTLLEIDTMRVDIDDALALYKEQVMPELRSQPGYAGVLVLTTPEGKGLLVSLWDSAEAADASAATGFYAQTLERFMVMFRSPPGRERYEVVFTDMPTPTKGNEWHR